VVGSDGKRVGEHRWRSRKLATGSFGREGGWRRGLRGGLGGGGANGGSGSSGRHGGSAGRSEQGGEAGEVGGVLATQMVGRRAEQG